MKVQDITAGASNGVIRSFDSIYEDTRKFFAKQIPSLPHSETKLDRTSFHLSVKELDVGSVFEIYEAEILLFVTYCCTKKEDKSELLAGINDLISKAKHLPHNTVVTPETDLFLYTIPMSPASPQNAILAGEIGFYIYHRIYQLTT